MTRLLWQEATSEENEYFTGFTGMMRKSVMVLTEIRALILIR